MCQTKAGDHETRKNDRLDEPGYYRLPMRCGHAASQPCRTRSHPVASPSEIDIRTTGSTDVRCKEERRERMDDKEEIYNEHIKPLIDQIFDLSEKHGIPFLAAFEVSEKFLVGSCNTENASSSQLELMRLILEHGVPTVLFDLAGMQAMEQTPVKVVD